MIDEKHSNTKQILVSIGVLIALISFFVSAVPRNYLNDFLLSHTISTVVILFASGYLYLVFGIPKTDKIYIKRIVFVGLNGLLVCAIINFPYNVIHKISTKPTEYIAFMQCGPVAKVYFLLLLVVIAPVVEEIYFRFYIYNIIRLDYGTFAATSVSAFLYMLSHGLKIQLLYLFVPGIVYAIVYEKTKTIWACIGVHGFNNLLWFALVYFA